MHHIIRIVSRNRLLLALAFWLTGLAAASFAQSTNPPPPLDSLVDRDGALWQTSPDAFISQHGPAGFIWVSDAKDSARMARRRMTFAGLPVVEAIARFNNAKLAELTLSLYNRGDEKEFREDQFDHLVATADDTLTTWAGSRGIAFKDDDRTDFITVKRKAWVAAANRLDLTWSYTAKHTDLRLGLIPFRCEYVRLQITPFDPAHDPRLMAQGPMISKTQMLTVLDLRKRVQHLPNGDVLITGVPMVDQGAKGYCAAAVTERVLRYFGANVDQNEIAQAANTTAVRGTSPEAMIAALRQIGSEFHVQVDVQQDFNLRDFDKLIQDYNHVAKLQHAPPLGEYPATGTMLGAIKMMDPALNKQARLKHDTNMADFKSTSTKYVNAGIPLVWSVVLGIVPETPPIHGFGGHMRLIIGYNDLTHEILYTDTWGIGHELKRMKLPDAWTMSLGLYTITPNGVHF